jgi:hypothetical protein
MTNPSVALGWTKMPSSSITLVEWPSMRTKYCEKALVLMKRSLLTIVFPIVEAVKAYPVLVTAALAGETPAI